MALENIYDGLTEEQKAKAKACRTPEELVNLAKSEGVELTDEQLEGIAGGTGWNSRKCPHCPSDSNIEWYS